MRLSSLDGLRALAALTVVLLHACAFAGVGPRTANVLGDATALAVELFFTLSGFVLTREWLRGRERREGFLWRRLTRLGPAYVLVSAASLAVLAAHGDLTSRAVWHELTLTQFATSGAGLAMPQAWSLGVEAFFYALLPVVLVRVLPLPRTAQLTALAVLAAAGLAVRPIVVALGAGATVRHALVVPDQLVFFLGGVALVLAVEVKSRPRVFGLAVLVLAGWLGLLQAGADHAWLQVDLLVRAAGVVLLVSSAPAFGRALTWLGVVSYPVYLWHWAVLLVLWHDTPLGDAPGLVLFACALAVVVPLSALTHRKVEVPGQTALRDRRAGQPVAS